MKDLRITKGENGFAYATSADIDVVRQALRDHGFKFYPRGNGWWHEAKAMPSGITFQDGEWSANIG